MHEQMLVKKKILTFIVMFLVAFCSWHSRIKKNLRPYWDDTFKYIKRYDLEANYQKWVFPAYKFKYF